MTIKSSKPGGAVPQYGQSVPLSHKSAGSVQYDHRSAPAENQGLLARQGAVNDSVGDEDYAGMLASASRAEQFVDHDAGADWAQDEFERRHDRRSSDNDPRVDSVNFPSDKDW